MTMSAIHQHVLGLVNGRPFGIHSVKDYGAVGDGIADDTAAVMAAVTAAAAYDNGSEVFIPRGAYSIGDVTVPNNVTLNFSQGGIISVQTGKTITINGGIKAGLYQIFSGSGTVAGTPKIKEVYPQWFGAKGDGVTDDTQAIQAAINLAISSNKNTVSCTSGEYKISGALVNANLVTFAGDNAVFSGAGATSLYPSNLADTILRRAETLPDDYEFKMRTNRVGGKIIYDTITIPPTVGSAVGPTYYRPFGAYVKNYGPGNVDAHHATVENFGAGESGVFIGDVMARAGSTGQAWGLHLSCYLDDPAALLIPAVWDIHNNSGVDDKAYGVQIRSQGNKKVSYGLQIGGGVAEFVEPFRVLDSAGARQILISETFDLILASGREIKSGTIGSEDVRLFRESADVWQMPDNLTLVGPEASAGTPSISSRRLGLVGSFWDGAAAQRRRMAIENRVAGVNLGDSSASFYNEANTEVYRIIANGWVEQLVAGKGLMMRSADNTRWQITVTDAGVLQIAAL